MPLYKQKGSDLWWVSLSHPDHPRIRRSTGTSDKKEAERFHDELKAQLWSQPVLTGRTWGHCVLMWARVPGRSTSDLMSMTKFARYYKDRPLAQVTADNLSSALAFCESAATYMRYRARLMAILNLAKARGWLRDVPNLPTKKAPTKARVWLTPEQWDVLFVKLPLHQRQMALFAVETGLRQANVLGLKWSQVDIERKLVWYEAEDTKSAQPLSAPLSEKAVNVLISRKDSHPVFVFTYRGRPIKEIKTAFQAACIAAGVGSTESGKYEGFTWHGLRHTWATWHVQNGTPLDVLQKLGGWSDLRMVMNYAHHSAGYLAQFANNHRKK